MMTIENGENATLNFQGKEGWISRGTGAMLRLGETYG
jgi:hypothetical protein